MRRYLLLLLITGLVASCDFATSPDRISDLVPRLSSVPAGTRVDLFIPAQSPVPNSTTRIVVTGFTTLPVLIVCQPIGFLTMRGELSGVMPGADGGRMDGTFVSQELSPGTRLGLLELEVLCGSHGSWWSAEVI